MVFVWPAKPRRKDTLQSVLCGPVNSISLQKPCFGRLYSLPVYHDPVVPAAPSKPRERARTAVLEGIPLPDVFFFHCGLLKKQAVLPGCQSTRGQF